MAFCHLISITEEKSYFCHQVVKGWKSFDKSEKPWETAGKEKRFWYKSDLDF